MTAFALGLGHDGHVTELAIDRLLYDPPGAPGLSDLRSHVSTCLVCKRRLDDAQQADAAVSIAPPAGLDWLGHLTELAINRLALDEFHEDLRFAEQHAERCDACSEAIEATAAFDRENTVTPPVAKPSVVTDEEADADRNKVVSISSYRAARRWFAPVAAALAASLAFAVLSVGPDDGYDDGIRLKGSDFGAAFFVHDGTAVRRVDTGDVVRAGERIGFRLRMPEAGHVMIIGVDSKGSVYACHPQDSGDRSRAYEATSDPIRIDEAMRFDDSPGYERLVAISCPQPFSLDDVRETMAGAARSLAATDAMPVLMANCIQRETVLEKASADGSTAGGAR